MAGDLGRVWHAETTAMEGRKALLRFLVDRAHLDGLTEAGRIRIEVEWRTGARTRVTIARSRVGAHAPKTPKAAVGAIRELLPGSDYASIAEVLNAEGYRTAKGLPFDVYSVGYVARTGGLGRGRAARSANSPGGDVQSPMLYDMELWGPCRKQSFIVCVCAPTPAASPRRGVGSWPVTCPPDSSGTPTAPSTSTPIPPCGSASAWYTASSQNSAAEFINAVASILKNPAYAGAFAYGRRIAEPARQVLGRPPTGRIRQPQERWLALVPDVCPAYISWAQYERNQAAIAENQQKIAERLTRKQALQSSEALLTLQRYDEAQVLMGLHLREYLPFRHLVVSPCSIGTSAHRSAVMLTGLVPCGLCGHAVQVAYKDGRFQYLCHSAQARYAKPNCQYLSGRPIDEAVREEFFRVLRLAEIDALERVSARQVEYHQELLRHLE
jgi:hypothetical protein